MIRFRLIFYICLFFILLSGLALATVPTEDEGHHSNNDPRQPLVGVVEVFCSQSEAEGAANPAPNYNGVGSSPYNCWKYIRYKSGFTISYTYWFPAYTENISSYCQQDYDSAGCGNQCQSFDMQFSVSSFGGSVVGESYGVSINCGAGVSSVDPRCSSSCGQPCSYAGFSVSAIPDPDYVFDSWHCSGVGFDSSSQVSISGSVDDSCAGNCSARFKPKALTCPKIECKYSLYYDGQCHYYDIPNCDTGRCPNGVRDCPDDDDPCTDTYCEAGFCVNATIPNCRSKCTEGLIDASGNAIPQCDDKNLCTDDFCLNGECYNFKNNNAGCQPSCVDVPCSDDDICTDDVCNVTTGECSYPVTSGALFLGCKDNCITDSDCVTSDPSLIGKCIDASEGRRCAFRRNPASGRCKTAKDCQDGDSCTDNVCINGFCAKYAVPGCAGKDNDGNGIPDNQEPPKDPTDPNFECQFDGQCDDRNKCTKDWCNKSTKKCQFDPIPFCVPDVPVDPNNPNGTVAGNWSKEDQQGKQISLASDSAASSASIDSKMTDLIKSTSGGAQSVVEALVGTETSNKGSLQGTLQNVGENQITTNSKLEDIKKSLTDGSSVESEKNSQLKSIDDTVGATIAGYASSNGIDVNYSEAGELDLAIDENEAGIFSGVNQINSTVGHVSDTVGIRLISPRSCLSHTFHWGGQSENINVCLDPYENEFRTLGSVLVALAYLMAFFMFMEALGD